MSLKAALSKLNTYGLDLAILGAVPMSLELYQTLADEAVSLQEKQMALDKFLNGTENPNESKRVLYLICMNVLRKEISNPLKLSYLHDMGVDDFSSLASQKKELPLSVKGVIENRNLYITHIKGVLEERAKKDKKASKAATKAILGENNSKMKTVPLNNRKDRPSVLPSENQPPTANISSLNLSNKAGTSASNIHQEVIEDEHPMEMVSGDNGVKNSQQRCLPLLEPAISGTGNCVINSSQTAHSDLYEELKKSSYHQVLLIIATCIMEMRNEMKDMKNDIKDMKIDIKDMKRDINSIKRNIGCLYEGQVLIHLEKASDM
ncbi:hypothetical protein C9374_008363 [Naegleria lovaniensis]|uniref:Uncharacterized protein n=1 Tax=Naegleria lovaniensis TaxID=51637 RepID=A0AA88KG00_NAELO|nr:uncharacterized protein C9374_008363 [Naegleria lovaniensis]KAG2378220.1 hypothetical protein C9374_008363 [Naegleria lovaniensis]